MKNLATAGFQLRPDITVQSGDECVAIFDAKWKRLDLAEPNSGVFRDHGITAALTALIGGTMALIAAITRKAFTNEALLDRLDRELLADRDRIDRQRSEDRKADGDRLDRIETDIRSMRDMLFDAFQRGRSD